MAMNTAVRFVDNPVTGSGQTIYGIFTGSDALNGENSVWRTTTNAFETYSGANWANYAVSLTERGAGIYGTSIPQRLQVPGRKYDVVFYKQLGGSPAITDTPVGTSHHEVGSLELKVDVVANSTCTNEGASGAFYINCTSEDGPVDPSNVTASTSAPLASAVVAAVSGQTSARKVTYTANASTAGQEGLVVVTVTFAYPSNGTPLVTTTRVVLVPVKICDVSVGLSTTSIADAVWKADRVVDSTANAWPNPSMGKSINLTAAGVAADAADEIATETWNDPSRTLTSGTSGPVISGD